MTKIEWTQRPGTKGETWNPVVGCSIKSAGCTNCYAMKMAYRLEAMGVPQYQGTTEKVNGKPVWTGKVALAEKALALPRGWKKPRTVFVNSMGDLFHEDVPDEWIDRVWAVMAMTPQHTYIVLTKRPERMREYLTSEREDLINGEAGVLAHWDDMPQRGTGPLSNVWLGTSAENQETADERIPELLATPAAIRLVSCEPLLGPIDLSAMPFAEGDPRHRWCALTGQALMYSTGINGNPDMTVRLEKPVRESLDWVISGGESGRGARPMHPAWARGLRDQCFAAGTPFFFKQWGEWLPGEVYAEGLSGGLVRHQDGTDNAHGGRPDHWWSGDAFGGLVSTLVGKKAAGSEIDGREWLQFPEAA